MKLLKVLSILLVLAMSGCIKEDLNDCPPVYNAKLTFKYTGDTDDEKMFAKMIDGVSLYVFDKNGQFVTKQEIDKKSLNLFQGTQLQLTPGEYTLVCWGNSFEQTLIGNYETFDSGIINHPDYSVSGKTIPTNDHLYYGNYHVEVPKNGIATGEILFKGAHINMQVYVQGLGISGQKDTCPVVEATNLMPQYGFNMENKQPMTTTYFPAVSYDNDKKASTSLFQVLRFADDNPVIINIKDPVSNEIKATVNLKDFMASQGITMNNKNEATISILFEFFDLQVKVTVPKWEDVGVAPN